MRSMRANSDFIINVYTMKIVDGKVYFIVDDAEDGAARSASCTKTQI